MVPSGQVGESQEAGGDDSGIVVDVTVEDPKDSLEAVKESMSELESVLESVSEGVEDFVEHIAMTELEWVKREHGRLTEELNSLRSRYASWTQE